MTAYELQPDGTLREVAYPPTRADLVHVVRCRDCKHAHKGGTLCNFFETWFPIAGGDEYEFMPADVEPDGFCKWGERRESE